MRVVLLHAVGQPDILHFLRAEGRGKGSLEVLVATVVAVPPEGVVERGGGPRGGAWVFAGVFAWVLHGICPG